MLVLVFGGCEHVQGAVAPFGVVPDLYVVMDCAGKFEACLSLSAVQKLDLHAGPEGLDHGVVKRSADSSHRGARPASVTFWLKTQDANWADSTGRRNGVRLEGS